MSCKAKCWKIGLLVVLGIAALGWVVMALWNWLIPTLFISGKQIDYVQAMGVLLLSKILFGSFRCHSEYGRWHHHRWEQMTQEEREKFQTGMHGRWHRHRWGQMTQDGSETSKEKHE